jgi:hypothetical protein
MVTASYSTAPVMVLDTAEYKTMSKLTRFQKDLQKGMSIDEALHKHQLTLSEAFHGLHYNGENHKKTLSTENKNKFIITSGRNRHKIRKTINHEYVNFGVYESIQDARRVRDQLLSCGWDKTQLPQIWRTLHIEPIRRT